MLARWTSLFSPSTDDERTNTPNAVAASSTRPPQATRLSSFSNQSPPPRFSTSSDSHPSSSLDSRPPATTSVRLSRLESSLSVPVASSRKSVRSSHYSFTPLCVETLHELLWLGVPEEARPEVRALLWKLLVVS